MKARNIIIALAIEFNGDWNSILNALQTKKEIDYSKYNDDDLDKINCLTLLDQDYPQTLKESYHPPFVLFYAGDISLLKADNKIAIVGTRSPDQIYLDFTDKFISNLSKGNVILSGGSNGICSKAVKTAVDTDKKVITVLAHGIDYDFDKYSYQIANNAGLILSEYPNGTPPTAPQFSDRNRIIATLANKVCSIQIHDHSGSAIVITQALSQGKDIYCVPNLTDIADTNNRLIEEGAYTLTLATAL